MRNLSTKRSYSSGEPVVLSIGRWGWAAFLAMIAGCGYTSDTLYRENVDTVFVDIAQSREFRRGIEFQFTEALRKQIGKLKQFESVLRNGEKLEPDMIESYLKSVNLLESMCDYIERELYAS